LLIDSCHLNTAFAKSLPHAPCFFSGSFDFEDVRMMTYLQAALSETLRLCPAVPSDVKFAIADDTFPSGATLKAGWRVAYHPFAQGHDPKVWGPDALDFKPERWIDEAGHFIQHSPYKFPSFQVGGLPPLSLEGVHLVHVTSAAHRFHCAGLLSRLMVHFGELSDSTPEKLLVHCATWTDECKPTGLCHARACSVAADRLAGPTVWIRELDKGLSLGRVAMYGHS
jgi:hypothetical protein